MNKKKSFKVYYLLISEGTTEFNLFGYLTTKKFKEDFVKSHIQFSIKVEIVEISVSQGKLDGVSDVKGFKSKYDLIKERYEGQKRFFLLDKDIDDSSAIEALIKQSDDIVQFIEHNSEYLLLKLSGMNPKNPSNFSNLAEFRSYCKSEFLKHFGKKASDFKDIDFDSIFNSVTDKVIKDSLTELFSTLS
ncbi:MAG: hypothetical protein Q7R78_01700 [bacterium]|nr:hypothetical protein [bacterium]